MRRRHISTTFRTAGRRRRSTLTVVLLTAIAACSPSWESEPLFSKATPQVSATATRIGIPELPNHYALRYSGAVGNKGFSSAGGAIPMAGEPVSMEVGDVNADGADDVVVLFAQSVADGGTTPRLHVWLQQRTATSMAMLDPKLLPALTEALAPGGVYASRIEAENGSLVLTFQAPFSSEERSLVFDFEAERWVAR